MTCRAFSACIPFSTYGLIPRSAGLVAERDEKYTTRRRREKHMYLSIVGIHNSLWKGRASDTTSTLTRMFESYPPDCLVICAVYFLNKSGLENRALFNFIRVTSPSLFRMT